MALAYDNPFMAAPSIAPAGAAGRDPAQRDNIARRNAQKKRPGWIIRALLVWWSRRESNPRPQALRPWHYMLSPVIDLTVLVPTGRVSNGGPAWF